MFTCEAEDSSFQFLLQVWKNNLELFYLSLKKKFIFLNWNLNVFFKVFIDCYFFIIIYKFLLLASLINASTVELLFFLIFCNERCNLKLQLCCVVKNKHIYIYKLNFFFFSFFLNLIFILSKYLFFIFALFFYFLILNMKDDCVIITMVKKIKIYFFQIKKKEDVIKLLVLWHDYWNPSQISNKYYKDLHSQSVKYFHKSFKSLRAGWRPIRLLV